MPADVYVDAALFMGMHADDDAVRVACKNFFVDRLSGGDAVVMSLEQVGRCDALIWGRCGRDEQDSYYPFMDVLHTDMAMGRIPYEEQDIKAALTASSLAGLELTDRLTLGMVLNRGGELVTVNPRLAGRDDLPVRRPKGGTERHFPCYLEWRYERSLALRVPGKDL
ncbi:hypothetical protein JOF56_010029 [Kibdelosporangium banguiense]|uniref:PIN domain-containing protein n=1 Tax=Kibdelosporangium banguiense TaxID=1365924 RepID=A0ABS4TZ00_9PSEU|nr:DUF6190 family protein [Kibdelosporangium banguiense]MBP2329644.1 hypothetical protein [Kibdelosporangium banguiense]